jgi:hypothetical protein
MDGSRGGADHRGVVRRASLPAARVVTVLAGQAASAVAGAAAPVARRGVTP